MNRIKEFYFGAKLSPEAFLARGLLTGVVITLVTGVVMVLMGIR